jgi:hypothetical protein
VPRTTGRVEYLETFIGPHQAHRTVYVLADRVSSCRNCGLSGEIGEDFLSWESALGGPATARRSGLLELLAVSGRLLVTDLILVTDLLVVAGLDWEIRLLCWQDRLALIGG